MIIQKHVIQNYVQMGRAILSSDATKYATIRIPTSDVADELS